MRFYVFHLVPLIDGRHAGWYACHVVWHPRVCQTIDIVVVSACNITNANHTLQSRPGWQTDTCCSCEFRNVTIITWCQWSHSNTLCRPDEGELSNWNCDNISIFIIIRDSHSKPFPHHDFRCYPGWFYTCCHEDTSGWRWRSVVESQLYQGWTLSDAVSRLGDDW